MLRCYNKVTSFSCFLAFAKCKANISSNPPQPGCMDGNNTEIYNWKHFIRSEYFKSALFKSTCQSFALCNWRHNTKSLLCFKYIEKYPRLELFSLHSIHWGNTLAGGLLIIICSNKALRQIKILIGCTNIQSGIINA